jgi:hypothetical protein
MIGDRCLGSHSALRPDCRRDAGEAIRLSLQIACNTATPPARGAQVGPVHRPIRAYLLIPVVCQKDSEEMASIKIVGTGEERGKQTPVASLLKRSRK